MSSEVSELYLTVVDQIEDLAFSAQQAKQRLEEFGYMAEDGIESEEDRNSVIRSIEQARDSLAGPWPLDKITEKMHELEDEVREVEIEDDDDEGS